MFLYLIFPTDYSFSPRYHGSGKAGSHVKRSGKRIFSACLLLGIALTLSVGLMSALSAGASSAPPEETYLWVRLVLRADPAVGEIRLYDRDGKPAQTLQTTNGAAVSGLLEPGTYFAATEQGCTQFTLGEDGSVRVTGGCGRADGERLWLTNERVGAVTVERLSSDLEAAEDGGWVDYTLVSETARLREVVRCTKPREVLSCTFEGVPYGEYVLEENGVAQCRVTVDENTPELAVSLP